jgi:hypothetical protein
MLLKAKSFGKSVSRLLPRFEDDKLSVLNFTYMISVEPKIFVNFSQNNSPSFPLNNNEFSLTRIPCHYKVTVQAFELFRPATKRFPPAIQPNNIFDKIFR